MSEFGEGGEERFRLFGIALQYGVAGTPHQLNAAQFDVDRRRRAWAVCLLQPVRKAMIRGRRRSLRRSGQWQKNYIHDVAARPGCNCSSCRCRGLGQDGKTRRRVSKGHQHAIAARDLIDKMNAA
jgi:hypothetical protein